MRLIFYRGLPERPVAKLAKVIKATSIKTVTLIALSAGIADSQSSEYRYTLASIMDEYMAYPFLNCVEG
jgi:hypothetical protein